MTNAERYKSADERHDAFGKFCDILNGGDCTYCKLKVCRHNKSVAHECSFYWLEAEYSEPISDCPYCSKRVRDIVECNGDGDVHVMCECGMSGPHAQTCEEAIRLWNKVCGVMTKGKSCGV